MRNQQGMTLIEMIVAILVLSIASMVLYTGFTKVILLMGDGASVKNATNTIVSGIENGLEDDQYEDIIKQENATASLDLQDGGLPVTVNGSVIQGELSYGAGENDILKLAKFSTDILFVTENERKAIDMIYNYNNFLGYGFNKDGVDYMKNKVINDDTTVYKTLNSIMLAYNSKALDSIYCNNDIYRYFFYYYTYNSHCTDYFCIMEGATETSWPNLDVSKMKKKDGTPIRDANYPYIQSYTYSTKEKGTVLIYAGKANLPEGNNRWVTRFIYNPDNKHWYYRTTGEIGLVGKVGSSADGTLTTQNWNQLKDDLNHERDGWVRIYEDE